MPRQTAEPGPPRRATSYDVAREAGVSQSAVSRCFRLGASISPDMRERIEVAARRLGYLPSKVARSLITRRSRILGVLVTDATARSYPELITQLGMEIQAADHRMLLFTLENEAAAGDALNDILAYQVDGIVSAVTVPKRMLDVCAERDIPVVLYNRTARHRWPASVGSDHAEAMVQLVEWLVRCRYRRPAFISGPPGHVVSEARLSGLRVALASSGTQLAGMAHADYSYEGGRRAARDLLRDRIRPDVLVCANDAMALGAMDTCRFELGLQVPDSVGVTGFDDVPASAWPAYALTTLRQPRESLALGAIELVLRHLEGRPGCGETRLLRAELTVRNSTRQPGGVIGSALPPARSESGLAR